jgi:hypothetical protein
MAHTNIQILISKTQEYYRKSNSLVVAYERPGVFY